MNNFINPISEINRNFLLKKFTDEIAVINFVLKDTKYDNKIKLIERRKLLKEKIDFYKTAIIKQQ